MSEVEIMDNYRETLGVLDELAAPLQQEYAQYMQCRSGCSACCLDGFRIRYIEALHLYLGLLSLSPERRQAVLDNVGKSSEERAHKCPVLVDDQCAAYHFRPTLCRAYGLLVKVDSVVGSCELNFKNVPMGTDMKTFDVGLFYDLVDELSQKLWTAHRQLESPDRLTIRDYLAFLMKELPFEKLLPPEAIQAAAIPQPV